MKAVIWLVWVRSVEVLRSGCLILAPRTTGSIDPEIRYPGLAVDLTETCSDSGRS